MNKSPYMLIDTPLSPHPPSVVIDARSLRRMEKSISSIVNSILLVDDDQFRINASCRVVVIEGEEVDEYCVD